MNGSWKARRLTALEVARKLEGADSVGINVDPADKDALSIFGEECNEDLFVGNVEPLLQYLRAQEKRGRHAENGCDAPDEGLFVAEGRHALR